MIGKAYKSHLGRLATTIQVHAWIGALGALLTLGAIAHAQLAPIETNRYANVNQALSHETGLSINDIETVLGEIDAMKRTQHASVIDFRIKAVTPERLSRIFDAPSAIRLPSSTRQNGLIFAGQSGATLMTFEKPSDVIHKGEKWFPEELARARRGDGTALVNLAGPFANWNLEPAAFTSLWNCLPTTSWMAPTKNAFAESAPGLLSARTFTIDAGGMDYATFKRCVREWTGREDGIPPAQHVALDKLATRVEQYLVEKFSTYLQKYRCKGVGIDDCVLVLHWWASLLPADPKLANLMQSLAMDAGMSSPLPPGIKDLSGTMKAPQPLIDEVWRREAFFHSKLISIFKTPKSWPKDALESTIREMDMLYRETRKIEPRYNIPKIFDPSKALRFESFPESIKTEGKYRSYLRRPAWELLPRDAPSVERVNNAVFQMVKDMSLRNECESANHWMTPKMEIQWLKQAMATSKSLPACLDIDWAWLSKGTDEVATGTREFISKTLADAKPIFRDQLLEKLTTDGRECIATDPPAPNRWLKEICKKWMPGPNEVDFHLEDAEQGQQPSKDFFVHEISFSDEESNQQRMTSLRALSEGMPVAGKKQFAKLLATLKHQLSEYRSAAIWRHNEHSRSLLQLTLFNGGNPIDHYYLLSPTTAKEIHVPERFASRFDGNRIDQKLARVSDRDQDGQLELWWANQYEVSSLSECTGDDSDLDRDLQCRGGVVRAEMGEINGDGLSYARLLPHPKDIPPAGETRSFKTQLSKIPPNWRTPPFPGPTCNPVLIGSVLGPALGITDWGKNSEDAKNVLSLTCKAHPLHPELTIVALFHNLPKGQEKSSEEIPGYGFAFGVTDIKRHRVVRLYQRQIEEDASLRIWGGSQLEIDTGRYWLKKGVRALGVRMDIGWSPSAAEGGDNNYLTLFVEEGQTLRPVLEFMPTYLWSYEGVDGCVSPRWANEERGDFPCDYVSAGVTLAVESVKGQEWRDLIARVGSGSDKPPRQVRLRYETGHYPLPGLSLKP